MAIEKMKKLRLLAVRDQKKVQFVILRDETGAVQLVNPATRPAADGEAPAEMSADTAAALALTETISGLATGTFFHLIAEAP